MKKIISTSLFIAFIFLSVSAQKKTAFEGRVTYDISFEGSGLPKEALDMMKGAQMVTLIKGDFRRIDLNLPMQSTSSIIDSKAKNIVTLMDIMGQKYLLRTSTTDLKKKEGETSEPLINYVDKTKEIAGYKCKEAQITTKNKDGKEDMFTLYYTDQIPSTDIKNPYRGLKGFPMEYNVQGGINMTFSAKTVDKESVPDYKFEIPKDGYKETNDGRFAEGY